MKMGRGRRGSPSTVLRRSSAGLGSLATEDEDRDARERVEDVPGVTLEVHDEVERISAERSLHSQ